MDEWVKWAMGPIVLLFGYLHVRISEMDKRMENYHDKREIEQLLGLTVNPMLERIERANETQQKMFDAIVAMQITMARMEEGLNAQS